MIQQRLWLAALALLLIPIHGRAAPGSATTRADSVAFEDLIEARRNRRDDFYHVPAGHIDLCNVPLPVRATGTESHAQR